MTRSTSEISTTLSESEREQLAECEATISAGMQTFVDVGTALAEVRDARLYRAEHGTFEDYCRSRWSLSRPRAYQLIEAAEVVSTFVDTAQQLPPPSNEAQARELRRVGPEQRADVWARAVEQTNGKPTAAAVRTAARDVHVVDAQTGEIIDEPLPFDEPPPSPRLTREQQDARDREASDRAASRALARCVWTLATNAQLADAAGHYVRLWRPEEDVYPEPTTAQRMRTAAQLLNDLADRWHR